MQNDPKPVINIPKIVSDLKKIKELEAIRLAEAMKEWREENK